MISTANDDRVQRKITWTGWRHCQNQPEVVGFFIWRGVATFPSGRKLSVSYYQKASSPVADDLAFRHYLKKAERMYDAPAQCGLLLNWFNRRRRGRPVAAVEWGADTTNYPMHPLMEAK